MLTERRGGWPGRFWHELDWVEVNMHRMKRLDEAKEKREAAVDAGHEVLVMLPNTRSLVWHEGKWIPNRTVDEVVDELTGGEHVSIHAPARGATKHAN